MKELKALREKAIDQGLPLKADDWHSYDMSKSIAAKKSGMDFCVLEDRCCEENIEHWQDEVCYVRGKERAEYIAALHNANLIDEVEELLERRQELLDKTLVLEPENKALKDRVEELEAENKLISSYDFDYLLGEQKRYSELTQALKDKLKEAEKVIEFYGGYGCAADYQAKYKKKDTTSS